MDVNGKILPSRVSYKGNVPIFQKLNNIIEK